MWAGGGPTLVGPRPLVFAVSAFEHTPLALHGRGPQTALAAAPAPVDGRVRKHRREGRKYRREGRKLDNGLLLSSLAACGLYIYIGYFIGM